MKINGQPILTNKAELLIEDLVRQEVQRQADEVHVDIKGKTLAIWLSPPKRDPKRNPKEINWSDEKRRSTKRAIETDMEAIGKNVIELVKEHFGFTLRIVQQGLFSVSLSIPDEQTMDYYYQ